jgi:hypothetical protein
MDGQRPPVAGIAKPIVEEARERPEGDEARYARPVSRWIRVKVECQKCGRRFRTDFYPYAAHPIRIRTQGADLAPHLREILEEDLGPFPELVPSEPPTHVKSCSKCNRPRVPREGDTFKKRRYRGRFWTVGRQKGSPGPEHDPENNYDHVDQTLSEAHRQSWFGKGIDHANEQSMFARWLHQPEQLRRALEILDTLSLREVEEKWGIPRMTVSRAKAAVKALLEPNQAAADESSRDLEAYWDTMVKFYVEYYPKVT